MGAGADMEGCGKAIKFLMFISNFVIWIGSIALLVFGVWAVADRPYLEAIIGESVYITAAYILISVGVVTFLISFLGCFGALKEVKCMLLMYFIIVLLLCVILLVGGILGFVFRQQASVKLKMGMINSIHDYGKPGKEVITKSWDDGQMAMECCGMEGRDDWATNPRFKNEEKIPKSCCIKRNRTETNQCARFPTDQNSYKVGCYTKVKSFVTDHAQYIGGTGVGVALLMILGLVFSIILFNLIK